LRTDVALSIGGETDFTEVNALTFDPGGGTFTIERIALGTDFNEIATVHDPVVLLAALADGTIRDVQIYG
jgi:hypothetical protein